MKWLPSKNEVAIEIFADRSEKKMKVLLEGMKESLRKDEVAAVKNEFARR